MNLRPHSNPSSTPRGFLAWLPVLAFALVAVGCDTLFEQSGGDSATSVHPGEDFDRNYAGSEDGRRELAAYVNFTSVLDSTDEQGWHTIYEHTLDTFKDEPTQENRLRLAIVLSRADRKSPESEATIPLLTDSRNLLAEAVNDPEAMPPLLRKFALLQLADVETRLALYEEMKSLRSQLAKAHQENQTAQRDRSVVEARMRRIDAALTEANAKLEAVMNIERNIEPAGKETFP